MYAVGDEDGVLYIAMRFVDGVDLGGIIAKEGPLPLERVAKLITQVADALDAAHARGLVHRDVKPGNILVTPSDHAYLTDFGLTKQTAETHGMTQTGMFVGTVDYMAPEQVRARTIDARTDIYSLGVIMYEICTGRPPYVADDPMAINPANGLPMMGGQGGVDIHGNTFGTNMNDPY